MFYIKFYKLNQEFEYRKMFVKYAEWSVLEQIAKDWLKYNNGKVDITTRSNVKLITYRGALWVIIIGQILE